MSVFKKFNNIFSSENDEVLDDEIVSNENFKNQDVEREEKVVNKKQTLNSTRNMASKGDVILREPLVFADSKDIIDDIKSNKVVILNLTKLDLKTSDRLLDFISGGIYAIDAKLKTIGDEIYLCVPSGIDVSGEFSEEEGDY